MANNTGWAVLSGIFKGLEGFPEGLMAGESARLKQEQVTEAARARAAQEAFQERQLTQTGEHQKALLDLNKMLGLAPYSLPKAPPPLSREPIQVDPTKTLWDPVERKPLIPATPKPPTPGEDVHAARQRVSAAWARGEQPTPTDLNLVNLSSQVVGVEGVGAFPKTEVIRPPLQPGLKPKPAIEPRLSPEEAGALGRPYGTTPSEAVGERPLTAAQRTKLDAQTASLAIVDNMARNVAQSGTSFPTGPLERLKAIPRTTTDVYLQKNPKLLVLHRQVEGTLALIVRSLGEVGTLTDGDIERARSLMPTFAPVSDTKEVIDRKLQGLRDLIREVASRVGERPQVTPTQRYGRDPHGRLQPVR